MWPARGDKPEAPAKGGACPSLALQACVPAKGGARPSLALQARVGSHALPCYFPGGFGSGGSQQPLQVDLRAGRFGRITEAADDITGSVVLPVIGARHLRPFDILQTDIGSPDDLAAGGRCTGRNHGVRSRSIDVADDVALVTGGCRIIRQDADRH